MVWPGIDILGVGGGEGERVREEELEVQSERGLCKFVMAFGNYCVMHLAAKFKRMHQRNGS